MVAVPQSLFKWMSSMQEETFDQIADALVHFSNEINEDKEIRIVFSIVDEEPKYFRFFAEMGELTLAGQYGDPIEGSLGLSIPN